MVSGFLISPYDHDRILSGLAIEMRIWSKTCAGTCGLKRFITSWFIRLLLACRAPPATRWKLALRCTARARAQRGHGHDHAADYSAASAVPEPPCCGRSCFELCRSTLRPSERISLTSTLNDSGMPASNVSSPRTIASYTLVRPATSSDFTVSISCSVQAAPWASTAHASIYLT